MAHEPIKRLDISPTKPAWHLCSGAGCLAGQLALPSLRHRPNETTKKAHSRALQHKAHREQ